MKDIFKEFKPTSWAINNRTSVFIITIIITLAGLMSFINLPKEQFPEIVIPTIYVSTVYPGTSPVNMENLVTRPIEKQIKSISGVKKVTGNSFQDFSNVIVEFDTDVEVSTAKQKIRDAVDRARMDLPSDLPRDPDIIEVDFSEMPMLYVNLSGDFDLVRLKKYADELKDKIEGMKEITRVDIVGALEREIQINVDMFKMQAAQISMGDIERAVSFENMTISGGAVQMGGMKRTLNVIGEFKDMESLENIVINSIQGAPIYLKDIAEVKDSYKEQESYARLNHKNVITLNVIKRSGENLIEASDKIREIVNDSKGSTLPEGLKVTLTGDQSSQTRITLHDLINTIIIGFILVTLVLMFFMGVTNAIFVALSVPLSMFLAFLIMPGLGFTLNMIVLFAFLLALGIVVDDAIVVIENTHRIFDNGKKNIVTAAKTAAGEVFVPVLSGTLTTLAPFIPLAFWGGIIGKFMFYLPITLIITLMASLFVAYIINPVFAVAFMKPHKENISRYKGLKMTSIIFIALAGLFYLFGSIGMGNFTLTLLLLYIFNRLFFAKLIKRFQKHTWPSVQSKYENFLVWALNRPRTVLGATLFLFILSITLTIIRSPKVIFFPKGEPNFIYVYLNLPTGTDQVYTDSLTQVVEKRVYKVIGENNPIVTSVISNVAIGATDPQDGDRGTYSNKSKIGIAFVQYAERQGQSTAAYLNKIREAVKGIPGAEITVDQEQAGPPVSKPISIEVSGDDFEDLVSTSISLRHYIDSLKIEGVEELKSDLENNKPEIIFDINRERANREGISTAQIGMEIRNAVLGKEVSKYKDVNDDYPIQLRYLQDQRNNVDILKNIKITYRDMNMGGIVRQVPLSSLVDIKYTTTYGGIKRKNQKRVITISSNVLGGFNPNEVVANVQSAISRYKVPSGMEVKMAGEQEEQKETSGFLGNALLISLGLIFLILVTQFNSFSKPIIILTEIIFSIIGVLLGLSLFNMDISIVMTGIGIVALAGIVVRNGILLVEFTDLLKEQGYNTFEAIVEAGKTRITPVILTATATILGLIPLAVGFNIDFEKLFTELKPNIYFGGDSVAFWGPLSWTMIFGLGFATFLTLILVPVMYLVVEKANLKVRRLFKKEVSK